MKKGTICSNRMHVFDGADFIIHVFVLCYKWQCPPCSVFSLTHIHKWKLCWFSKSMLFSPTECESQSSWAECRGNALGEISTDIQHCAQCKLNEGLLNVQCSSEDWPTPWLWVLVIVENRISFWSLFFADALGLFSDLFPFMSVYLYIFCWCATTALFWSVEHSVGYSNGVCRLCWLSMKWGRSAPGYQGGFNGHVWNPVGPIVRGGVTPGSCLLRVFRSVPNTNPFYPWLSVCGPASGYDWGLTEPNIILEGYEFTTGKCSKLDQIIDNL